MKYHCAVAAALFAGSIVASAIVQREPSSPAIRVTSSAWERSLPDAPNNYVPTTGSCPSTKPSVRSAGTGLSKNESSWLEARRKNSIPAMQDLLGRLVGNLGDFSLEQYFSIHSRNTSALPNVAIAFSGGGYRACLSGAGAIQAFDSREGNLTVGHLGGLLQSATYIAGLSGGSWLLGSIYVNNFTTISALQNDKNVWDFSSSIFDGPQSGGIELLNTIDYFQEVYDMVQTKKDANFNTTITDYWGRALSYQLINATNGGPSFTWSSIRQQPGFPGGEMPMPLVVADSRSPGESLSPGNSSVFEFGPFEFGTWDPSSYGFVDIEYLGTEFNNGSMPDNAGCVRGFDNAGFVMGTSSSLFNQFLVDVNGTNIPSAFKTLVTKILQNVDDDNDDIASYKPNPFKGYNPTGRSLNAGLDSLTLTDGGNDLQNIPLHPLIQPVRHVDVIFAVDSSADTSHWPNGTALVATYERSLNSSGLANHTVFPSIPSQNTFVNLGLNTRPTFFGCDASNSSGPTPLVVYIPNSPYVYNSNVSTFDPMYNTSERNAIIANGYHFATMGNGSVDAQWSTCVGCAILSRSFDRTNTTVPEACANCFKSHCWDGTINETTPAPYNPSLRLKAIDVQSAAASLVVSRLALAIGITAGILLM